MLRLLPALLALTFVLGAAGCASSGSKGGSRSGAPAPEESRIIGDIPKNAPFAKLELGMSMGEVHELIGQPTDTISYQTGKMWIPFYFGKDAMRMEELYRGQGRITYTGAGIGGTHFKVYRVIYDANEPGHPKH